MFSTVCYFLLFRNEIKNIIKIVFIFPRCIFTYSRNDQTRHQIAPNEQAKLKF